MTQPLRRYWILFLILVIGISSTPLLTPSAASSTITGLLFRDYNANGVHDPSEPGVSNITLTAYDVNNLAVATTTTDAQGNYTLTVPNVASYRVEVTNLPSFLYAGPHGLDSRTTVSFVDAPATGVNIALSNPAQFCQQNPDIATSCYTFGALNQPGSAIVTFAYTSGDSNLQDPPTNYDNLPGGHPVNIPNNQVGTTWGMAYQKRSGTLFASAFIKRHSAIGPGGPGAIYQVTSARTGNTNASVFLNLNALFGTGTAGTDPHNPLNNYFYDDTAFDAVGKSGLGGLAMADDDQTLWTIALGDRRLYKIPIGNPPVAPTAAAITRYDTPRPADCTNDTDVRPFAVTAHDGLIYIGLVCSGQSGGRNALRAYVYAFDPTNTNFTQVLNESLTYPRGCANYQTGIAPGGCMPGANPWPADWQAWTNNFNAGPSTTLPSAIYKTNPQPILTGIAFNDTPTNPNTMILGIRDRFGDQMGTFAGSTNTGDPNYYSGFPAGDTLLACPTGGGGWAFESNSVCGSNGPTGGKNKDTGPGGGSFYYQSDQITVTRQSYYHGYVTLGSVLQVPGQPQVTVATFNPIRYVDTAYLDGPPSIPNPQALYDSGIRWFSNQDGTVQRIYRLFDGQLVFHQATVGKAAGVGGLAALCDLPPLEIGNRVWYDTNKNGIQDAGEKPIAKVTLNLYLAGGTTPVGTTTTDSAGEYYFNSSNVPGGGILPNTAYEVRIDNPADFAANGPLYHLIPTLIKRGTLINDSNGVQQGVAVIATVTTGDYGQNDHTIDFGFVNGATPTGVPQFSTLSPSPSPTAASLPATGYPPASTTDYTGWLAVAGLLLILGGLLIGRVARNQKP
jgi:hypothetical protein